MVNLNGSVTSVLYGSVLGWLLFTLYINDIMLYDKENINIAVFADDTSIVLWGKDKSTATKKTNSDL